MRWHFLGDLSLRRGKGKKKKNKKQNEKRKTLKTYRMVLESSRLHPKSSTSPNAEQWVQVGKGPGSAGQKARTAACSPSLSH